MGQLGRIAQPSLKQEQRMSLRSWIPGTSPSIHLTLANLRRVKSTLVFEKVLQSNNGKVLVRNFIAQSVLNDLSEYTLLSMKASTILYYITSV